MPPRRNDPEKDSPHMKPSRRAVITASALRLGAATIARAGAPIGNAARFSTDYAPHEGSFASRGGLVGPITFAADQGFPVIGTSPVCTPVTKPHLVCRLLREKKKTQ